MLAAGRALGFSARARSRPRPGTQEDAAREGAAR